MFSVNGKSMPAHRFAYLLENDSIPESMVIHQTCENTDCVNPNHLVLQSKSQNKKNYTALHVSAEMVETESIKFLFRLKTLRPELEEEIDMLLSKLVRKIEPEEEDFGYV